MGLRIVNSGPDLDWIGLSNVCRPTQHIFLDTHEKCLSCRLMTACQVKTTQNDALMFYGGGNDNGDFLSIELVSGHVRYIFDVGSGVRVLADRLAAPINDNAWHTVSVLRPTVRRQLLIVDRLTNVDELPDSRSVHFDLPNDDLYIGGLPARHRYGRRGSRRRRPSGFQGCLASIILNGKDWTLSERRADIDDEFLDNIVEGCEGLSRSALRRFKNVKHLKSMDNYCFYHLSHTDYTAYFNIHVTKVN